MMGDIKSEKLAAQSQVLGQLAVPQIDGVTDSSAFRAGGPEVNIMTLRTETAADEHEKIGIMLTSKELSLKEIQDRRRQSRYERMDDQEKSMLKSAISKVVTDKAISAKEPGETLEKIQERILQEVYNNLQTRFAEVKEGHEKQLDVQLADMTKTYEDQLKERMDKAYQETSDKIEQRMVEI